MDKYRPLHTKTLSFFRIRFSTGLQYRSAALAGMATQFAWGFMLLLLYTAFYETGTEWPMTFQQLVSYIWLQQAFLALLNFYAYDGELVEMIRSGGVAYELLRPMGVYHMWFVKSAATRISRAVLRCLPILVVAVLLPAPYRLGAPASFGAFLLFALSMLLGLLLACAFVMLVYSISFYTVDSYGVRILFMAVGEFLSGGVVPLPFFPPGLRQIVELSPFGGSMNTAFRIYSGSATGSEMWLLLGAQVFWVAVLILGGVLLMKRALRRVVVQGG